MPQRRFRLRHLAEREIAVAEPVAAAAALAVEARALFERRQRFAVAAFEEPRAAEQEERLGGGGIARESLARGALGGAEVVAVEGLPGRVQTQDMMNAMRIAGV